MNAIKKLVISLSLIVYVLGIEGCNKKADETVTPVDTTPEYQKAIDAKFRLLGWDNDGHAKFNGSNPVPTAAGKGYVQYYALGSRKTAIYYFEGKGAFAMDTAEMDKYESLGSDNFGYVVSDPKTAGTGAGFNEIITLSDNSAGIIIGSRVLYGKIYEKYLGLNRWDGPLGYPLTDILKGNSSSLTYAHFAKNSSTVNGQIYFTTAIKAQAFWGRIHKLYGAAGWDAGWLGLPTESCDPNKADNKQFVRFQGGNIDGADCGSYFSIKGIPLLVNGNTGNPPCY